MRKSTVNLVMIALFCALSAIGANLKVMGSVAFDSMPAFLAAVLIGPAAGALVGALGHMLSAALAGFQLTLPLHIAIAIEMALICAFVGWLVSKKNAPIWLGSLIAFVLNAFLAPGILIFWPGMGWAVCVAFFMPLAIASAANVLLAALLAYALKKPYAKIAGSKKQA